MKHNFYAKFIICALALAVQGFAAEKQRIEQTVGIIKTEHDLRCGEFNRNIKVLQRTKKIDDLLKNEGIVSKTQAEPDQKKTILQAVMAGQLIHFPEIGEQKFAASIYLKPGINTPEAGKNDYRFKHFEILRLTEELSYKIAELTHRKPSYNGYNVLTELNGAYKDISTYSGVKIETLAEWFRSAYDDHQIGLKQRQGHAAAPILPVEVQLKQGYGAAILQAQPDHFGAGGGGSSGASMFARKEASGEIDRDPMKRRALAPGSLKKPGGYIYEEDDTDLAAAIAASLESAPPVGTEAPGKMPRGYRAPGDEVPSDNNEDRAFYPLGAAVDYEYQPKSAEEAESLKALRQYATEDALARQKSEEEAASQKLIAELLRGDEADEAENLKAAQLLQVQLDKEERAERERLAQLDAERERLARIQRLYEENDIHIPNAPYVARIVQQPNAAALDGAELEVFINSTLDDKKSIVINIFPVMPRRNIDAKSKLKIKFIYNAIFIDAAEDIIVDGIKWTIDTQNLLLRGNVNQEDFITPERARSAGKETLTYTFQTPNDKEELILSRQIK